MNKRFFIAIGAVALIYLLYRAFQSRTTVTSLQNNSPVLAPGGSLVARPSNTSGFISSLLGVFAPSPNTKLTMNPSPVSSDPVFQGTTGPTYQQLDNPGIQDYMTLPLTPDAGTPLYADSYISDPNATDSSSGFTDSGAFYS